jgi:hypothetical protein
VTAAQTKTAHLLPVLAALMAGIRPLAAHASAAVNSRLGLNGSVALQEPGFLTGNSKNALGINGQSRKLAHQIPL